MAGPRVSRMIFILACINCINGQYFDFFQSLQPYFQPPPSQFNIYNEFTTRRPRPKQKPIFTDTRNDGNIIKVVIPVEHIDKRRKQSTTPNYETNYFSTTQKPIRKTTKATITLSQHSPNRQNTKVTNTRVSSAASKLNNNAGKDPGAIFFEDKPRPDNTRGVSKSDTEHSSNRQPISSGFRDPVSSSSGRGEKKVLNQPLVAVNYDTDGNYFDNGRNSYNYFTTKPPFETTKVYQQNNRDNKVYFTTHNPVNNQPIRPLGPPITNKPVTQRPDSNETPSDDASPEIITGPDEDSMSAVEKKRHIDVAERMCEKYKSLNVKKVEAIPLVPSPQPVTINVTTCPPTNVPLVVGGKVVTIQEFPHMALLGWKRVKNRGYSWKCGGSLLSNQYVLTAGHCGYQDRDDYVIAGPPRVVQLGSSFLGDPKATVVKVAAVIRHPKYKQPKSYYDLAIIKMASPVSFSETIKPACLGVPPRANEPIIATGWGKTEFGGGLSRELRSVSIPVWDLTECHNALGTSIKIPYGPSSDSQICAGEKSGGKDTCQGDSGGPAQMQDGCLWRVVAVTSVGRSCGAADTPAIYATVQRAFISAVVFGNQATSTDNRRDTTNDHRNNNNNNQGVTNNNRNTNSNNNRNDEYNNNRGPATVNTNNRNDFNSNKNTQVTSNNSNNRNDEYNNRGQVINNSNGNDFNNNRNTQVSNNNNRNDEYNNNRGQATINNNNRNDNNNNKNTQTSTNNNRNDNNRGQPTTNHRNDNNNRNQQTTNSNRNDNWSNNNQQTGFVVNQQNDYNPQTIWNTQTNPTKRPTYIDSNANNWNNQRGDNNNYNQNKPYDFNYNNYNTPNYNVPRDSDYYNYNRQPYNDGSVVYNGGNVWWT